VTDDNVRENVADELRLAGMALAAAETLLEAGIAPDAASRAYYAAFHAARALLFSIGLEPRSHGALRSLVGRHFVRTGKLAALHGKELAQLEGLRESGDYDSGFALGVDDVAPEVEKARRFLQAARALLEPGNGA
jgi:uncharacterized protein (UPF0332 family)